MRIDGSSNSFTPSHVARAYGVSQPRAIAAPASTEPLASIGPTAAAAKLPTNAQSLIAARVSGPVQFDGVSVPSSNPAALNLYTRAADKIEAATAVQIGRTIDVKG